jgi:hypothetical protein
MFQFQNLVFVIHMNKEHEERIHVMQESHRELRWRQLASEKKFAFAHRNNTSAAATP